MRIKAVTAFAFIFPALVWCLPSQAAPITNTDFQCKCKAIPKSVSSQENDLYNDRLMRRFDPQLKRLQEHPCRTDHCK